MDTVSILMAQYGGKAVVPLADVCRDYFAPLTVPTLVRKISAGEIELILVRIDHSRKSAKGVRLQDLAHYLDTRETIGTARVKPESIAPQSDNAPPAVGEAPASQPAVPESVVSPTPLPREPEGAPPLERALTLKMAAELLKVSYGTVYERREELGFFQIGSVWRVWPATLKERLETRQKEKSTPNEKASIAASNGRAPSYAWIDDARKAEKEFAELVTNRLSRRRRASAK